MNFLCEFEFLMCHQQMPCLLDGHVIEAGNSHLKKRF